MIARNSRSRNSRSIKSNSFIISPFQPSRHETSIYLWAHHSPHRLIFSSPTNTSPVLQQASNISDSTSESLNVHKRLRIIGKANPRQQSLQFRGPILRRALMAKSVTSRYHGSLGYAGWSIGEGRWYGRILWSWNLVGGPWWRGLLLVLLGSARATGHDWVKNCAEHLILSLQGGVWF